MSAYQYISKFFMDGGIFMYPLLFCSVVVLAVIVHRVLNARASQMMPEAVRSVLDGFLRGSVSLGELKESISGGRSPLAVLVSYVLSSPSCDEGELRSLTEVRAKEVFVGLQSGLPLLDMMIMIAPMFGILGTASGLVLVFSSFGMENNQGVVSQGIANALNTTIAGLAIATPAVIANICFGRRLEQTSSRMEVLLSELIAFKCKGGN